MALLGFLNKEKVKGKKASTKPTVVDSQASTPVVADEVITKKPSRSTPAKRIEASVSLHTLLYPSVTEKSTRSNGSHPCVTFIVERTATKSDVRRAVVEVYGVSPLSIQIVNEPERRYRTRTGGDRVKRGLKKAMVNFPSGTEIDVSKVPHA